MEVPVRNASSRRQSPLASSRHRALAAVCAVALSSVHCGTDTGTESATAETFLAEYPPAFCDLWAECNPAKLQDLYDGDLSICVEDLQDTQEDRLERDGCNYDERAAADCLDTLATLECVDWEEGEGNVCGDVIDCS